ncbi:ABC transporter permease [Gluconobacter cerinus]|uniref:ABC transporter permease n=1 Tax=Gluconobacter cerinus TaxID=38307 RepID=UPI001B8BF67D|nr:ABC transporter permease [Gluconobacter cerinus]MBS1033022.1 ABC transporter permease [Gluconobacter cerinus]
MGSLSLTRQEWSDLWRALQLYASPVFLRANYLLISVGFFLFTSLMDLRRLHRLLTHETFEQALSHAHVVSLILTSMFIQNCLQLHATRQIGAAQAPAIPGLAFAEARAVCIVDVLSVLLLSTALSFAPIPFHDALFFVLFNSIPTVLQWYVPPQGQSQKLRFLIGLAGGILILGQYGLLLLSNASLWLLTRPPILTIPADVCLLLVMIVSILSLPNRLHGAPATPHALDASASLKDALPEFPYGKAKTRVRKPITFYQLRQMLLAPTSPLTLKTDILLSCLFIPVLMSISAMGMSLFTHKSFAACWKPLVFSAGAMIAVSDNWLTQRQHWPLLLITGRFGDRLSFVRSVFSAKLSRLSVTIPLRVLSLIIPYALITSFALRDTLVFSLEFMGLALGFALCGALPFLVSGNPWKGVVYAFNFIPIFLLQTCNPFITGTRIAGMIAGLSIALGCVAYVLAPRSLSKADWPYETE